MAIATAAPEAAYDEWRTRRWRLTGLAFALAWLVVAATLGLAGEKRSDLPTLEASIADGSVTHVEIVGFRDYANWQGSTRATLRWHGALVSRFVEVEVDTRPGPTTSTSVDRIVGDPADHLRADVPGLEISWSEPRSGTVLEWHDWRGPGWAGLLGFGAWFGTILLAGNGPEPWRATKWAWIWVTLSGGPIGCLAYLLLGGPLGLWRPRDLSRRLTGGWAFLLSLVLFGGGRSGT